MNEIIVREANFKIFKSLFKILSFEFWKKEIIKPEIKKARTVGKPESKFQIVKMDRTVIDKKYLCKLKLLS